MLVIGVEIGSVFVGSPVARCSGHVVWWHRLQCRCRDLADQQWVQRLWRRRWPPCCGKVVWRIFRQNWRWCHPQLPHCRPGSGGAVPSRQVRGWRLQRQPLWSIPGSMDRRRQTPPKWLYGRWWRNPPHHFACIVSRGRCRGWVRGCRCPHVHYLSWRRIFVWHTWPAWCHPKRWTRWVPCWSRRPTNCCGCGSTLVLRLRYGSRAGANSDPGGSRPWRNSRPPPGLRADLPQRTPARPIITNNNTRLLYLPPALFLDFYSLLQIPLITNTTTKHFPPKLKPSTTILNPYYFQHFEHHHKTTSRKLSN